MLHLLNWCCFCVYINLIVQPLSLYTTTSHTCNSFNCQRKKLSAKKKNFIKKGFWFLQKSTLKSFFACRLDLRTWNNFFSLGNFSDEINKTISPQFFLLFTFSLFPSFSHFFLSLLHCIFQSETFLKCLAIGKDRNFRKLKGSNSWKAWVFQNLNIN
jgi:hypothetical protein